MMEGSANVISIPRRALIGHTGFVGSNLARQRRFDGLFNSRNIGELNQSEYDVTVCAAVSAVKWKANLDPQGDWQAIEKLLESLKWHSCRRFILISTVDVYPNPNLATEDLDVGHLTNHAYGTNRRRVEEFIVERFPDHYIVRLPGLFGDGLKKNVIFDLLNNRELEVINPNSSYQYYDLSRLSDDLDRAIHQGIRLLNLATEPILTGQIIRRFFASRSVGQRAGPTVHYDFRSRYSSHWGSSDGYLYSAATVLDDLERFLVAQPGFQRPGGE